MSTGRPATTPVGGASSPSSGAVTGGTPAAVDRVAVGNIPGWLKQQAMFFRLSSQCGHDLDNDDNFLLAQPRREVASPPPILDQQHQRRASLDHPVPTLRAAGTLSTSSSSRVATAGPRTAAFCRTEPCCGPITPPTTAQRSNATGGAKLAEVSPNRAVRTNHTTTNVAVGSATTDTVVGSGGGTAFRRMKPSDAVVVRTPPSTRPIIPPTPVTTLPSSSSHAAPRQPQLHLDYTPEDAERFRLSDGSSRGGRSSGGGFDSMLDDDEAFLTGRVRTSTARVATASSAAGAQVQQQPILGAGGNDDETPVRRNVDAGGVIHRTESVVDESSPLLPTSSPFARPSSVVVLKPHRAPSAESVAAASDLGSPTAPQQQHAATIAPREPFGSSSSPDRAGVCACGGAAAVTAVCEASNLSGRDSSPKATAAAGGDNDHSPQFVELADEDDRASAAMAAESHAEAASDVPLRQVSPARRPASNADWQSPQFVEQDDDEAGAAPLVMPTAERDSHVPIGGSAACEDDAPAITQPTDERQCDGQPLTSHQETSSPCPAVAVGVSSRAALANSDAADAAPLQQPSNVVEEAHPSPDHCVLMPPAQPTSSPRATSPPSQQQQERTKPSDAGCCVVM